MSIGSIFINWVDIAIVIFVIFYVFDRYKKGLIFGIIDLLGFILSFIIALRFYHFAGDLIITYFKLGKGIGNALGFFITATLLEMIYSLAAFFIEKLFPTSVTESKINKLLGFLPPIISCYILLSFFIVTLLALPIRPNIKQDVIKSTIGGFLSTQTLGIETNVSEVFGGALQEALTFLTVKPEGEESVNLNFKTDDVKEDPESESQIFALVNNERNKRGIKLVTKDTALRDVGRKHCIDMFKRGYFSHYTPDGLSPFDRMNQDKIQYQAAGENLAYAPSVAIAHTGLMNSPGHKANILSSDFGKLGVGVIDAGVYGKMFCQEFSD